MLGGTLEEIAANQFVSRNTVKSHVRTSHLKLHVSTRTEATEIMRRFVQQRGESPVFDERKHPEPERQKYLSHRHIFMLDWRPRSISALLKSDRISTQVSSTDMRSTVTVDSNAASVGACIDLN